MPSDNSDQFPLPVEENTPLTDPIASDLSSPPTMTSSAPQIAQPQPATLPSSSESSSPLITMFLLTISVLAVGGVYFFYQQNKNLNLQLAEVTKTIEQQKTKDDQTPTPTPSDIITPTTYITGKVITPTLTITPSITPTVPVPNVNVTNSGQVFDLAQSVIAVAQNRYPEAQLLMVNVSGAENSASSIVKYWFRQTATTKKYLYILRETGKQLSVVDQQVYVTPDNNIPSLNQMANNEQLGIDLNEAITIATNVCPIDFDCVHTPITGQFIKANTPLWQISFKPTDGSIRPFVVQIDSVAKKILFKSR